MSTDFPSHKFPALGEEPFNLTPEEMAVAWGSSEQPESEAATAPLFEGIIKPSFKFVKEVWMRHFTGARLRIDYVAFDRSGQIPDPIGFELKKGRAVADDFSGFTHAVRQSIDYSKSTIQDSRAQRCNGASLRYVFVFPCPYQIYEHDNSRWRTSYRDLWAQGILKLATESGVGAMGYVPRKKDWGLFLGGHPAWWLKSGPTELAKNHSRAKNVGSAA